MTTPSSLMFAVIAEKAGGLDRSATAQFADIGRADVYAASLIESGDYGPHAVEVTVAPPPGPGPWTEVTATTHAGSIDRAATARFVSENRAADYAHSLDESGDYAPGDVRVTLLYHPAQKAAVDPGALGTATLGTSTSARTRDTSRATPVEPLGARDVSGPATASGAEAGP
ncbi:hypothetical protein [Nocardia sp. XZ_19_369]|uniref:hypothetical protein n=1 Tax=Nocardia sp. XZ_19_369 TaxID=2769487 RepID=UPI0018901A4B|nr:hypothetical protein [Nocardia sp. XZ_19_369]